MNKINLLMVVATWVFGHVLIYNLHQYLTGMYEYNVPFLILLFVITLVAHYRLSTHMISKISIYL